MSLRRSSSTTTMIQKILFLFAVVFHPYWLAFLILEGAMRVTRGEK